MKTTVMKTGPAEFNMCGQVLGYPLTPTDESISAGLAKRLHNYAVERLADAGFKEAVAGWEAEVYTLDADSPPADRSYGVRFKNAAGGYIELIRILTKSGWPSLDHGYAIGCE